MTPTPLPSPDFKERFYRTYYSTHVAGRKGEASLEQFALRARIYDAIWGPLVPPDRSATILDVGCGTGSLVWWLQQRGYEHAAGIDVSPEQVETARRLGVRDVMVGDVLEHLRGRTEQYDALIFRDVLEHLERPRIVEVLDRCREALRPGGVVIAQVPNAEAPFWGRIRYGDFTHELAFTESSLRQVFGALGYGPVSLHPAGPVRLRWVDAPRQALWRCLEALYKLMIYAETGRRWAIVTESIIAVARGPAPIALER